MRLRWACIIFVFVFASFIPSFYELREAEKLDPSRSFELIHNYYTDYNFYLSRIRQGYDGNWLVHEIYTNESHIGTIIHEFYVLLGQGARFIPDVSFAVPAAYHVARAVFGTVLLVCIAWGTTQLCSGVLWQILAFLFVVTSFGLPRITQIGNGLWRFNNFMPWWTVLEPLQRITFIPHILVAQLGVLFLILAGGSSATITKKGNWIVLGILAMGVGIVMPQALMMVFIVYGIQSVIEYVIHKETRYILPRAGIGILSVWTILYFVPFLQVYPWKRLVDFEILHPITFSYLEYLKTLGIALPLGLCGALFVLMKRDKPWYPVVSWAIGVPLIVLLMLLKPIQHPLRFTEMAAYIPLGLLSVYLVWVSIRYVHTKHIHAIWGSVVMTIPILSILYGSVSMIHQFYWQKDFINMKIRAGWPALPMNNYIVYPSAGFMEIIMYINSSVHKNAIIFSEQTAGNYIPARTGRRVYVGHENTSYKEEKLVLAKQFYKGQMDPKQAYLLLRNEGVTHVFVGPEEKQDMEGIDLPTRYPFLRQIVSNADAMLYELTITP